MKITILALALMASSVTADERFTVEIDQTKKQHWLIQSQEINKSRALHWTRPQIQKKRGKIKLNCTSRKIGKRTRVRCK